MRAEVAGQAWPGAHRQRRVRWAGRSRMLDVVAAAGATYVCMHWRGHSDRMQEHAAYDGPGGVVAAVRAELAERVDAARAAGIGDDRIVLDPGLGFAKTAEQNWALLSGLDDAAVGWAFRCWSARAARRSWGRCWPGPTARRSAGRRARGRRHRADGAAGPAGVWGLRVHDVRVQSRRAASTRRAGRGEHVTDELTITGHRVLRAPRCVRRRASRRTGVRGRPRPGARHPRGGGLRRLAGHRRLRKPRGRR